MNRRLLIIVLMACLLPLGMQAQQGTFRFAQLTDIHLTPNNPNPTEDLLRSIAQINATDSIDFVLVTGDLTETKVHVHTNDPGNAIQYGIELGELVNVKVDNMLARKRALEAEKAPAAVEAPAEPAKEFGMVAVSLGDGSRWSIRREGTGRRITGITCGGNPVGGWFVSHDALGKGELVIATSEK